MLDVTEYHNFSQGRAFGWIASMKMRYISHKIPNRFSTIRNRGKLTISWGGFFINIETFHEQQVQVTTFIFFTRLVS